MRAVYPRLGVNTRLDSLPIKPKEQYEASCLLDDQRRRHGRGGNRFRRRGRSPRPAEFEVCAVCHGDQGEGFEKYGAPRIGGQEDWYIITSLKNFRAGLRARDNCDVADVAGTLERAKAQSPDYAGIEAELATHFDGGALPAGGACSPASNDVYGPLMRAVALTLADDQAVEDLAAYRHVADAAESAPRPLRATSPPAPWATPPASPAMGRRRGQPGAQRAGPCGPARLVHGAADGALYRRSSRHRPAHIFDTQMRPMAMVLPTPDQIRNVTAYINTFTASDKGGRNREGGLPLGMEGFQPSARAGRPRS